VPSLCDDFGTEDLAPKLAAYQPGWYASWNDLDPGTLEDLHTSIRSSRWPAFPPSMTLTATFWCCSSSIRCQRPGPRPSKQNLRIVLPDDKIDVPIE